MKRLTKVSIDELLIKQKKKKINELFLKLRKTLLEKKTSFEDLFVEFDPNGTGIVSRFTFCYVLEVSLGLGPVEVELVMQVFNSGIFRYSAVYWVIKQTILRSGLAPLDKYSLLSIS